MDKQRNYRLNSAIVAYIQCQHLLKHGTLTPVLPHSFRRIAGKFVVHWKTLPVRV